MTHPVRFWLLWLGGLGLGLAGALNLLGMSLPRAGLVSLNSVTFLAYGLDRAGASAGAGRIPERVLHLLAGFGGTPGAFAGQHLFRHKIRDRAFLRVFYATAFLQAVLLLLLRCGRGD